MDGKFGYNNVPHYYDRFSATNKRSSRWNMSILGFLIISTHLRGGSLEKKAKICRCHNKATSYGMTHSGLVCFWVDSELNFWTNTYQGYLLNRNQAHDFQRTQSFSSKTVGFNFLARVHFSYPWWLATDRLYCIVARPWGTDKAWTCSVVLQLRWGWLLLWRSPVYAPTTAVYRWARLGSIKVEESVKLRKPSCLHLEGVMEAFELGQPTLQKRLLCPARYTDCFIWW